MNDLQSLQTPVFTRSKLSALCVAVIPRGVIWLQLTADIVSPVGAVWSPWRWMGARTTRVNDLPCVLMMEGRNRKLEES